jgi:TolB-like protein/class 3 adenylate cyclase/Flp pilus assembly protein TadD
MQESSLKRRLAAILAADVVGYSRLMASDDTATVGALDAARAVFRESIQANQGRVIDMAGDSVLAVFDTASGAVTAGLSIQNQLNSATAEQSQHDRMQFRIGIHLGDVIEKDDGTVYGDGVNIAARLESLAQPGGVTVSDIVYGAVRDIAATRFEDAGEHDVKNISRPVHAYHALTTNQQSTATSASIGSTTATDIPKRFMNAWLLPALGVVVLAIATLLWFQPTQPTTAPADPEKMAFKLPDKPSIAVLPFNNITAEGSATSTSDDSKSNTADYFSDGMTEDLITDLSKVSGLFVVARNSTFAYKGRSVETRQIAEELGVRYVLEGSVRRADDTVRINAQLIDAVTGGHLWAERYDGNIADVFALQDRITSAIVQQLSVTLLDDEVQALSSSVDTNVPAAHDAFLLGSAHLRSPSLAELKKAKAALEKAVDLDPNYSRAWAALAQLYYNASIRGYLPQLGIEMAEVPAILEKAMVHPSEEAFVAKLYLLATQGRFADIPPVIDDLADLGGNDTQVHVWRAIGLAKRGDTDAADQNFQQALRLSPNDAVILALFGRLKIQTGENEQAVDLLERSSELDPGATGKIAALAAAYALAGQTDAAKQTVKALIESRRAAGYVSTLVGDFMLSPVNHPTYEENLAKGLRLAGLPDKADPNNFNLNDKDRLSSEELSELIKSAGRATGKSPEGTWIADSYLDGTGIHYWLGKEFARSDWSIEGDEHVTRFRAPSTRQTQRCRVYRNANGSKENLDEFISTCNSGVFRSARFPIPLGLR